MDRLVLFHLIPWNFVQGRIPRGPAERRAPNRKTETGLFSVLRALLLLLLRGGCSDGHTHSLFYLYTALSEPVGDLPQFTALGYVDGFLAGSYNSLTERAVSQTPWMKKIEGEDPHFWDWMTNRAFHSGQWFRKDLKDLLWLNNQSQELHVWQRLYGCELAEDGSERGYDHYAYDAKDFLSFNKATLNWTALNAEAEMIKKKWDAELDRGWRKKMYLEGECFAWLKKCLEYGTEVRARKRAEPPVVTIRSKTEAGNTSLPSPRLLSQGDRCLLEEGWRGLAGRHPPGVRGSQLRWDLPLSAQRPDRSQREGPLPVPRGARWPAGTFGCSHGRGCFNRCVFQNGRNGDFSPPAGGIIWMYWILDKEKGRRRRRRRRKKRRRRRRRVHHF